MTSKRFHHLAIVLLLMYVTGTQTVWGQALPSTDPSTETGNATAPSKPPEWRDTSTYPFPSIAYTLERMQFLAYAQQLREYCANRHIPDTFVKERLHRFSAMTGREETCKSLLDY